MRMFDGETVLNVGFVKNGTN